MKVLIPEKFSKDGIAVLEDAGYDVTFKPDTTPEQLLDMIPDYDALIVRSATTVTREVIEAGKKLKIIGRAGVGVDNIDREAATERGVIVCNAPLSNIVSAAEQTMALMLAVARNTARADKSMKDGKWDRSKFVGTELQGKTLGIFGTGHVGQLVAERAAAFGMNLIGYDPYCPVELAAQRGSQFRYRAFYVPHLREGLVEGIDDVHGHALDRALRDGHAFADDFVDGQVVDGLLHGVVRGDAAQFGRNRERHLETVSDALFEVVTAVEGVELHALKIDRVEHRRMQYAQSGRFLYGAFPIAMKLIRRSRDSSSSCRAARAGICPRSGPRRSPGASRRPASPC